MQMACPSKSATELTITLEGILESALLHHSDVLPWVLFMLQPPRPHFPTPLHRHHRRKRTTKIQE